MPTETTIGHILEKSCGGIQTGPFGTKLKAAEYTADGVPVISVGEIGYGRNAPSPPPTFHLLPVVLGALDDKIEQNRRTARALERLARAIFRAWFVDFEPVKAKAAGATAFPSMPQPVFDALPTRFVDSAIGPVPEGWEVKRALPSSADSRSKCALQLQTHFGTRNNRRWRDHIERGNRSFRSEVSLLDWDRVSVLLFDWIRS
jgi:hypothetical protein